MNGEDVSIGRCGAIDCLYIADIGDISSKRNRITIYRVPEPAAGSASTTPADAFHPTYPDHPARNGELYLVSESSDADAGGGALTRLRCDFIR